MSTIKYGIWFCFFIFLICNYAVIIKASDASEEYLEIRTSSEGYEYRVKKDGTVTLSWMPNPKESIVYIPETIDGYTVTAIYKYTFPIVGFSADELVFPKSITYIPPESFLFVRSIGEITVDEENASYASKEGVLFDKEYKKLVYYPKGKEELSYQIPDGVKEIGEYAFYQCSLKEIDISDSVEKIDHYAFTGSFNLEDVYIPKTVKQIEGGALTATYLEELSVDEENPNCKVVDDILYSKNEKGELELVNSSRHRTFKDVVIPEGVKIIGMSAFDNNIHLTKVVLDKELEEIDDFAFHNCASLKDIEWNSNIKRIGKAAFTGCDLSTIELPEGLVEIGSCAFADSGVVKIKMPDSLQKIDSSFFDPDIPEENFEGIIASRNSYAAKWAEENGIAVEYTD